MSRISGRIFTKESLETLGEKVFMLLCESSVLVKLFIIGGMVSYSKMTALRKQHRRTFKKSPQMRPRGWNHMACQTCADIALRMHGLPDGNKAKREAQAELDEHYAQSDALLILMERKIAKCRQPASKSDSFNIGNNELIMSMYLQQ